SRYASVVRPRRVRATKRHDAASPHVRGDCRSLDQRELQLLLGGAVGPEPEYDGLAEGKRGGEIDRCHAGGDRVLRSRVFACSGLAFARDDRRALWCKRSRAIGADAWRAADAAIDAARDKHRARLRALRQPCNVYAFEGYRSPVNATGGRSEIIDRK